MAEIKTPMRMAGAMAAQFINSKLTPLFIVFSLLLGALRHPARRRARKSRRSWFPCSTSSCRCRAHRRQKSSSAPAFRWSGCCAKSPVWSTCIRSRGPALSMLVVRFYVGTKEEDAIVKAYNKLYSNFDRIPAGVSQPIIKVRSIDDVPIMALTLWGKNYDSYQLAADRGRAGQPAQADRRRFGDEDHRRPAAAGAGHARHAEAGGVWHDAGRGGRATGAGECAQRFRQLFARQPGIRGGGGALPGDGGRLAADCRRRVIRGSRCICAMWRRRLPTGHRSRRTTFSTRTARRQSTARAATIRR